jgi:hypothetical protein
MGVMNYRLTLIKLELHGYIFLLYYLCLLVYNPVRGVISSFEIFSDSNIEIA